MDTAGMKQATEAFCKQKALFRDVLKDRYAEFMNELYATHKEALFKDIEKTNYGDNVMFLCVEDLSFYSSDCENIFWRANVKVLEHCGTRLSEHEGWLGGLGLKGFTTFNSKSVIDEKRTSEMLALRDMIALIDSMENIVCNVSKQHGAEIEYAY
jgi:hypothetical protein